MNNNHKFFNNSSCKYFPCHKTSDNGCFNCLFCYCPLYNLDGDCGGKFKYSGGERIKNCTDCELPHLPEYFDIIMVKLKEARGKGGKL